MFLEIKPFEVLKSWSFYIFALSKTVYESGDASPELIEKNQLGEIKGLVKVNIGNQNDKISQQLV